MKLIDKIIKWCKRELWIRREVKRLMPDKEELALLNIEEDQNVPSREKVHATRLIGNMLRQDSERYHNASMKFLETNPGKDFSDFDKLDSVIKSKYF